MRRPLVAGLILILLATSARAQDAVSRLSKRLGQTVDLASDPSLKETLVADGLVSRGATSVEVKYCVLTAYFQAIRRTP